MSLQLDSRAASLRASAGAMLWAFLAVSTLIGLLTIGPIELLFLLAPLVAAPIALALAAGLVRTGTPYPALDAARVLQPIAAILAAASFFLPPGSLAAALVTPWLLVGACAETRFPP